MAKSPIRAIGTSAFAVHDDRVALCFDGDQSVFFDVKVTGANPEATSRITYSTKDSLKGQTVTVPAQTPWDQWERVSEGSLTGMSLTATVDNPTISPYTVSVVLVTCRLTVFGRPPMVHTGDGMCTVILT
ncbi:hypothetical protein ACIP2X_07410 [Streptomyces sp. NPDC089424]|uniref:hypothetical protein n=1 Tax=Streptomyces sp. NPDC089424 TaxID=3365917 RepID=UPI00382FF3AE